MKKLLLIIAFTLLFTLFSCTPDDYETEQKNKPTENIKPLEPGYADGPGDGTGGVIPPPTK